MPGIQKLEAKVILGDARDLPIEDNSIDLIITSPPYFSLRKYKNGEEVIKDQIGREETPNAYLESLWEVTRECRRVLKPTGSLFWNINDKYNSAASNQNGLGVRLQGGSHESNRIGRGTTVKIVPIKSLLGIPWRYALGVLDGKAGDNWILRGDIIWNKINGLPDPTSDRVARKHEYLFHFTKRGKYFSRPVETSIMSSVWNLPTEPLKLPGGKKHPARFPIALPIQLIRGWCPEGGTVLDPFGGSGTVAVAAIALNRVGISIDISADYCDTAKACCENEQLLEKARKTKVNQAND